MARLLRQSTAFTFRIGPFLDSTDGVTAETALSIAQADIQISKDGGAFAQTSASPTTTHDTDGWYQCPLTSTDTNTLGPLTVQIVVSGALPVWEHFMVVPANVYDSLVDGSDLLDTNASQLGGTSQTGRDIGASVLLSSGTGTGQVSLASGVVSANAVQISGDSTAADNLEAALDGTGGVTISGSLSGSVGSVTGAVGSVTGNVGGNVSGSVGSVTGNVGGNVVGSVGSVTGAINTAAGTITTLDGLDTAQDTQHSTTQSAISGLSIPSAASIADAVLDEALSGHTTAGTLGKAVADIEADATAILEDTGTTLPASLATIDSNVDAILVDTGTTLPATLGTPAGADLATDIANVKTDTAAILTDTGTTLPATLATIDAVADQINSGIIYGAAATGTLSTTQASTDLTGYADDQLIGRVVTWLSGACEGESTDITDYASTNGVLTFTALTTAPGNGDTFKIT